MRGGEKVSGIRDGKGKKGKQNNPGEKAFLYVITGGMRNLSGLSNSAHLQLGDRGTGGKREVPDGNEGPQQVSVVAGQKRKKFQGLESASTIGEKKKEKVNCSNLQEVPGRPKLGRELKRTR